MSIFTNRGVNIYELMKRPKGAVHKKQSKYRGPMSFEFLDELEHRNNARITKTIREMGNKWAHHPDNHVKRKDGKVYK